MAQPAGASAPKKRNMSRKNIPIATPFFPPPGTYIPTALRFNIPPVVENGPNTSFGLYNNKGRLIKRGKTLRNRNNEPKLAPLPTVVELGPNVPVPVAVLRPIANAPVRPVPAVVERAPPKKRHTENFGVIDFLSELNEFKKNSPKFMSISGGGDGADVMRGVEMIFTALSKFKKRKFVHLCYQITSTRNDSGTQYTVDFHIFDQQADVMSLQVSSNASYTLSLLKLARDAINDTELILPDHLVTFLKKVLPTYCGGVSSHWHSSAGQIVNKSPDYINIGLIVAQMSKQLKELAKKEEAIC